MKPGDKLLCKKQLKITYRVFEVNKLYEIDSMEYSAGKTYTVVCYEEGDFITFSVKNYQNNAYFYLYDWFYTVEEVREIKIDELLYRTWF